jgi:hypothetical protein
MVYGTTYALAANGASEFHAPVLSVFVALRLCRGNVLRKLRLLALTLQALLSFTSVKREV